MCVIRVFKTVWGTTYFGYGNNDMLCHWSVDAAGQFGFHFCHSGVIDKYEGRR